MSKGYKLNTKFVVKRQMFSVKFKQAVEVQWVKGTNWILELSSVYAKDAGPSATTGQKWVSPVKISEMSQ